MDKLPPEILHRIFIERTLRERLKYTVVCRSWYRTLDKYSLLYDIITYNKKRFIKFMEMIKQLPHRAAQVEYLDLCATIFDSTFNKRTLLNIFPNVRVLKVEWDNGPLEEPHDYIYFNEPIEVTHSKSKITVLHDGIYCELASQILTSNLCGRLEELKLNFAEITGISTDTVLGQLKNLPALKKLKVQELCIGVKELETIHQNLPTIREFSLHLSNITASKMLPNVMPATLINDFDIHINAVVDIETHVQFYQYMVKKYNNAEHMKYHDEAILYHEPNDRKRVHLNGILDFYKLVKPNSKKLKIQGIPDDVDIFEVFDSKGCQFEEIETFQCDDRTLFQYLAQSNQSKYVQKMTLVNTEIGTPSALKNMMALTTLKLTLYDSDGFERVNLTEYLNGCPATLKHFSIICPELRTCPTKTHLNSIETLSIECEELTKSLADTISTCFPKLVRLKITVEELEDDVDITLQNHPLEMAHFWINQEIYGFLIKTPSQTKPQFYLCEQNSMIYMDYDNMSMSPKLSFTSFTGKKLDLSYNGIMIVPD